MVYWVYVLESLKGGHRYVGSTHDVEHRLDFHNAGLYPLTKEHRPWKVIFKEEHPTRLVRYRVPRGQVEEVGAILRMLLK